jgi:hypothetical protein
MTEETLTAIDYEVPAPGQYRVKVDEAERRDGRHGAYYRINSKIVGGDFDGAWVSFVAGAKLTPSCKLRHAVEDILGRPLESGEKFNPKSLVGHEAIAEVSNTEAERDGKKRTYANIDQFFTLRESNLRQAQEAAQAVSRLNPPDGAGYGEDEEAPLPDWD